VENETDQYNYQYRIEFENMYFEAISEAEQMINSNRAELHDKEVPPRNSYLGENNNSSKIKLAALKISVFNGNYADWTPFYDMFVALIHNNNSLTPV